MAIFIFLLMTDLTALQVNVNDLACDAFVESIIQIESRGNDNSIARDGSAGPLQIKPVLVKDVNRILRYQGDSISFTLADRFDRKKAIDMFWIYQNYYGSENDSFEVMARRWNGGPGGPRSKRTKKYWQKVSRVFVGKLQKNSHKSST